MAEEQKFWIATVQGMDWECGSICETQAMLMATDDTEASTKMEAHAAGLQAIIVPESLQGPYSMDEALKVSYEFQGRYLPEAEAKEARRLLVQKGFLKA